MKGLPKGVIFKAGSKTSLVKALIHGACMSEICDAGSSGPCTNCIFSESPQTEYTKEEKWEALQHVFNL